MTSFHTKDNRNQDINPSINKFDTCKCSMLNVQVFLYTHPTTIFNIDHNSL